MTFQYLSANCTDPALLVTARWFIRYRHFNGIESKCRAYRGFSEVLKSLSSIAFYKFSRLISLKRHLNNLTTSGVTSGAEKVTGKPNAGSDFQNGDGNSFSKPFFTIRTLPRPGFFIYLSLLTFPDRLFLLKRYCFY